MSLLPIIDFLKSQGLEVFGPEEMTTYAWFTNGHAIGYVQVDRFEGVIYSTVHKPNRQVGTGYRADNYSQALLFAPAWASGRDLSLIKKYKDSEEFKAKHWQKLTNY